MATFKKTELVLDHQFNPVTSRHTINGWCSVLHCHHFATLYTQLADDCGFMDARKLLGEVAEDNFYAMLVSYFAGHELRSIPERIAIGEQYFGAIGLGRLEVTFAGGESGEVTLHSSHIDAGWIKKWGQRDTPVNFVACGYISALFAAVFDRAPRTFVTKELESIVAGAAKSRFQTVAY